MICPTKWYLFSLPFQDGTLVPKKSNVIHVILADSLEVTLFYGIFSEKHVKMCDLTKERNVSTAPRAVVSLFPDEAVFTAKGKFLVKRHFLILT